jgi:hypothetical protein
MEDLPNKRRPAKAPERSQSPLWFVAVGLGIVLFSHGLKDEMIADVVFWAGIACAAVALLYWGYRPKHGL